MFALIVTAVTVSEGARVPGSDTTATLILVDAAEHQVATPGVRDGSESHPFATVFEAQQGWFFLPRSLARIT